MEQLTREPEERITRLLSKAGVAIALAVVIVAMGCTTDTASRSSAGRSSSNVKVCANDTNGGRIGTITGRVNADVMVPSGSQCNFAPDSVVNGDIEVQGIVSGNIKVNSGKVNVRGRVDGNIEAVTENTITVAGTVHGNIENEGGGDVVLQPGSRVAGNIKLQGNGDVSLRARATVDGNIEIEGGGYVTIERNSTVRGNVKCGSAGGRVRGTVVGDIEDC